MPDFLSINAGLGNHFENLKSENSNKENQIASLNQKAIDDQNIISIKDKEINKWLWWFFGAAAIGLLSNGFWIFNKIKSV